MIEDGMEVRHFVFRHTNGDILEGTIIKGSFDEKEVESRPNFIEWTSLWHKEVKS